MILPSLLGRGAVVAAHAVVNKEMPPLAIAGGVPAKVIGQRNPRRAAVQRKVPGALVLPASEAPSGAVDGSQVFAKRFGSR